jgi:hypothetical protein
MKLGLLIGLVLTASPVLIAVFVNLAVTFGAPRETGHWLWLSLTALTVLTPIGIVVLVVVGLLSIFTKLQTQQQSDRNAAKAHSPLRGRRESAIDNAWRVSNGAYFSRAMKGIFGALARYFVAYSSAEPKIRIRWLLMLTILLICAGLLYGWWRA